MCLIAILVTRKSDERTVEKEFKLGVPFGLNPPPCGGEKMNYDIQQ